MTGGREIAGYELTNHAVNQMKSRNIGVHEVELALEGDIKEDANKPHQLVHRLDFPGVDLLVVTDERKDNIVTAFYDDEQGAAGGRL